MIENRRPNSNNNIISLPQPEKGMFKTRDELGSYHKINSGKVSVERFPVLDDVTIIGIRVGSELGEGTLELINNKITSLPDASMMKEYSERVNSALPSVEMSLDGKINFFFEDEVVADITSTDGFAIKNEYFEDDAGITSVKLIRPETSEDMYEFRFTRRQEASTADNAQESFDHILSVSYFLKTVDFKGLHNMLAEVVANPHSDPEKIREIINAKFDIRVVPRLKTDDSDGGGALLERDPFDNPDSDGAE